MKMFAFRLTVAILLFTAKLTAAQIPHIAGTIDISMKEASISCNLLLTNVPKLDRYAIWLNSGFNIQYFRDSANRKNYKIQKKYDDNSSYESFQYSFLVTDSTTFLPAVFRVRYMGSFPIFADTSVMYDRMDWKGNIAFNGKTLRAADQTAWYPQIYDIQNDVLLDKYTYDLKVNCADCDAVFLNGDKPKAGHENSFTSTEAASLLLYAGKFKFKTEGAVNFLNSGLTGDREKLLGERTTGIINFYEQQLHIPYGKKINYISTTAVSKNTSWLFVTYPTVVVVGNRFWDINKLFSKDLPLSVDTSNIQTISHELGHYYFGTLFIPNSTLRWVFLEGMTEYISLQYTRKTFGEEIYKTALADYIKTVRSFGSIIPLSKIKRSAQVGEGYRYYYIPLLLTALEEMIGLDNTWRWLSGIAKDNAVTTNYDYFKSSLLRSGISEKEFNAFEEQYINNSNAIDNVIAEALR